VSSSERRLRRREWVGHVTPKRVLHSNFGCCIGTIKKSATYKISAAVERRKFLYRNLLKTNQQLKRKTDTCPERIPSAVSILAMADGMDAEGVVRFFRETDAVVADAEAQLAGLSLELLDIALTGLGEAKECGEDAHGGVAVEAADVGAGALGPDDFLHA
jgi:hypothetical protein